MEITGRLTADAVVRKVTEEKKVVGFTIAVNDSYRSGEERREIATFFECSYWRNEGIAEYLKKGDLVQVYGRVGVNAYLNRDGEARAALTFHVSEIKLFEGVKGGSAKKAEVRESGDLPVEQAVKSESAMKPSTAFDNVPSVGDDGLGF
ncbi:single-stranded DNA-binding protein [Pedobacter cryotolerans]|uniref:Single-stranded DNA-binding protein n=1 Tax=Pedobacter cryotolerans TaxID=2571270 RepID=A0A4U1BUQ3_9SPHI|nr:single-stranded DNA-binding protein [Pedobacter cryotolerans]TKB96154.1 single-stranded DNA-binding protein [Pedobacter cryotolerans]